MQVAHQAPEEFAACVVYGATVLVVSAILKLTPEAWAEKIPVFIDENKAIDPNDPVMKAYAKSAKAEKKEGVQP